MNEQDIALKLFANVPIEVEGIGNFQLPTLRDIISLGYSNYQNQIAHLLFTKDSLDDQSNELDSMTDFELLINYNFYVESFRVSLFSSFLYFFNSIPKMLDNGVIYFNDLSEESILTEEKWETIKKIVKIAHFIPEKEEYKAGNEKARKLIEKIMKNKKAQPQQEKINLQSILSGVAWRTTGIDSLLNKTIYQAYDGYYRLGVIDNHNFTMTGIYTGNIDSSKIKLSDINWTNIIKLNN